MSWRTKSDNSNNTAVRVITSIVIKAVGDKLTLRLTYADGSFNDVDAARVPRFDLGDILTITVTNDIAAPPITRDTHA